MIQLGGFLSTLLGPLLKTGLLLIGNILKPVAKNVLVPLGLTAAVSATDAAIQKIQSSTLVFSNEYLNDILKIIESLEEFGFLIKGVSETVENGVKEQKGRLLGMLTTALGASLLGNMLAGKGVIRAGKGTIRAG